MSPQLRSGLSFGACGTSFRAVVTGRNIVVRRRRRVGLDRNPVLLRSHQAVRNDDEHLRLTPACRPKLIATKTRWSTSLPRGQIRPVVIIADLRGHISSDQLHRGGGNFNAGPKPTELAAQLAKGAITAAPQERTPDLIIHSAAFSRFFSRRREVASGDGGADEASSVPLENRLLQVPRIR